MKGEKIDAWYAGKTSDFGGNIQALFAPGGLPLWTSDVEPGNVADIVAARRHVLPAAYPYARTMPVLADPGYEGAGHGVHTPVNLASTGQHAVQSTNLWLDLQEREMTRYTGVSLGEGVVAGQSGAVSSVIRLGAGTPRAVSRSR
ncbi:transposase family protein [Streptomyces anulatus]|uniref:transposase family protein n=1 Tax=Streptomyces anulatus TaxID=1892 RepID=UPI003F4DF780